MNDYDELIEHCRNMYELGFGKMDAVADTLEQLANKCKGYETAIKGLASMEHFYPDGTTFYITSENIIEKEVGLRLKAERERDAAVALNEILRPKPLGKSLMDTLKEKAQVNHETET